jgi:hypothetical protein
VPGFFVEKSALPAASLLAHADADDDTVVPSADALGLGIGVPGAAVESAPHRRGIGALLFGSDDESLVGVCLLPDGDVVRLCGRVMQSFDCDDDCCKRALVRMRMQLEAEGAPVLVALAKSEMNLGDYWNWTSAVCSFTTDEVAHDGAARDALIDAHFRTLANEPANPIGTDGIVCVGPMELLVKAAPGKTSRPEPQNAAPAEAAAVLAAVLKRRTSCRWTEDLLWLERTREVAARSGGAAGAERSGGVGEAQASDPPRLGTSP